MQSHEADAAVEGCLIGFHRFKKLCSGHDQILRTVTQRNFDHVSHLAIVDLDQVGNHASNASIEPMWLGFRQLQEFFNARSDPLHPLFDLFKHAHSFSYRSSALLPVHLLLLQSIPLFLPDGQSGFALGQFRNGEIQQLVCPILLHRKIGALRIRFFQLESEPRKLLLDGCGSNLIRFEHRLLSHNLVAEVGCVSYVGHVIVTLCLGCSLGRLEFLIGVSQLFATRFQVFEVRVVIGFGCLQLFGRVVQLRLQIARADY